MQFYNEALFASMILNLPKHLHYTLAYLHPGSLSPLYHFHTDLEAIFIHLSFKLRETHLIKITALTVTKGLFA